MQTAIILAALISGPPISSNQPLEFHILIAPPPAPVTAEEANASADGNIKWSIMPLPDPVQQEPVKFSLFDPEEPPEGSKPEADAEQSDPEGNQSADQADKPDTRPVVYLYVGDVRTCRPCAAMKQELDSLTAKERAALPFRYIYRAPPSWVRVTPTAHWSEPDGVSRQMSGWTNLQDFLKRWEASMQRARLLVQQKEGEEGT